LGIEDEQHFVLNCPVYKDLRFELFNTFSKQNIQLDDMCKSDAFFAIMDPHGSTLAAQTVYFVHAAFDMRKKRLLQ
jgi:hypothetical protein